MRQLFDVVVAGAGPAGLAAAIEAGRAGLDVVVLDPHDVTIDKACGEGILPGGVDALEELGVTLAGLPFVGVRYADAADADLRALGRFPAGVGLGVRRTVLQSALRERALACGASILVDCVRSFEEREDGVLVNGELLGHWLIGADGLHSSIRRRLGVGRLPRMPRRLGLRRHYAVRPWSDRVEVYFGEHAEAYVTPVAECLVGVALLFGAQGREESSAARFDRLLAGFPLLRARLGDSRAVSTLRGAGPFEQRVARRVVGRVLLVGDAAGYVDPLTGDGVGLGVRTAQAAIRCVLANDPLVYELDWERLTRRSFALTTTLLAIVRRRQLHGSFLRAARSCPVAFDAALGLMACRAG